MIRTWMPALIAALACVLLLWRLERVTGELEAERLHHAATTAERDHWQAAAEMYRQDAEAQAGNARLCLAREAKAALDLAEREAIVRQATPRVRSAEEKVVDDATRRRAVLRLNRPL